MDYIRRLVALLYSALQDLCLVYLPVMAAHFLDAVILFQRYYVRASRYHSRVDVVRLRQPGLYAVVLRDVAVSMTYVLVAVLFFQPFVERPPHDPHKGFVTEARATFDFFRQRYLALMILLMACLTESHKVVWAVSSRLPALYVVDVQYLVFALAFAAPAGMIVPEKYVLTHVPEVELRSLLVLLAGYLGILDLLYIKAGGFYYYLRNRQYLTYVVHHFSVRLYLILDRRREPAFVLAAYTVVESRLAVSCIAAASASPVLPPVHEVRRYIVAQLNVGGV